MVCDFVNNFSLCRRIRVSIEHNLGENISAPKAIRIFVPYWIVNDTYLPLVYKMVELEEENAEPDTDLPSARTGLRNPTNSIIRRNTSPLRVLETIEDSSLVPSMLSPQDYFGGNTTHFSSQKDAFISPRVGICVAVCSSETSNTGITLHKLESKVNMGYGHYVHQNILNFYFYFNIHRLVIVIEEQIAFSKSL